ncbi:MAG: class I SAM-dependent methyltransferase [Patescibacteria group bacterium]|jgi:2-polyprenyl-3-methyl-5-hydroxy-6-metoxy-1,4-benzoquinol methylase
MLIKNILRKIYFKFFNKPAASGELEGNGERVDIKYQKDAQFDKFDLYQKSHYRRYEFARDYITTGSVCGDFACGTGYGSMMLAEKSQKVIGVDLNSEVIEKIKERYANVKNVEFINSNLLDLKYSLEFDSIISFETIEHLMEDDIVKLLNIYHKALKLGGKLIFSTPYMQERSENAIKLGFHQTFYINEEKIMQWLKATGFTIECFKYQNYQTHLIQETLGHKDFIISVAKKN